MAVATLLDNASAADERHITTYLDPTAAIPLEAHDGTEGVILLGPSNLEADVLTVALVQRDGVDDCWVLEFYREVITVGGMLPAVDACRAEHVMLATRTVTDDATAPF